MTAFRAGAARVDVTPPVPVPLAGYTPINVTADGPQDHRGYVGRTGVNVGVHDPVHARALVLDDGDDLAVIVALDLCITTRAFTDRVRETAQRRWGIDPQALWLAASHNHSGPDFTGHWEDVDPTVADHVAEQILDAIGQALSDRRPARVGLGHGDAAYLTVNRRDSSRAKHSGVPVLRVDDESGDVIAVLYSFACHPIVAGSANRLMSAEYPGVASGVVEEALGGVCLFLNGAAGNVNPVAFPYDCGRNIVEVSRELRASGADSDGRTLPDMVRFGLALGGEVLRVAAGIETSDGADVACWRQEVDAALKDPEALEEFLAHVPHRPAVADEIRSTTSLSTEVSAIRVGPLTLLALPGEPFAEIAAALEDAGPSDRALRVVGYVNDYPGYVLPPDQYRENRYETVATPLAESGASAIIDAAAAVRDQALSS